MIPEDIHADTVITEELILDICRNRVFYVPELVGKDVPRVYTHGVEYKDIPHLPLVVCESPKSFKAPDAIVSAAMSHVMSSNQDQ